MERAQQERQRQEDDTNAALAKVFDEIQARIDADHELAIRLTHEEQEKYTIEEIKRLLAEFFDQRKKQLAAARAEAIRNKSPTKTQVMNRMITYLKHMEAIKDSEKQVDSSSKPAGGSRKKTLAIKRVAKSDEEAAADYEHEREELRMWLIVVSDEEEIVDLMILSAKYPIVDWESHNLGSVDMEDLHVYMIIRADGNTSYYKSLSSYRRSVSLGLHSKAEEGGAIESSDVTKVTKPKAAKGTKPETPDAPSPAKRSKGGLVGKRRKPKSPLKLVDEPSDEGVPGPAHPVVLREPDSGKYQPLLEVQGKGKEKFVDEQAAHDLLTLQTPTKKSLANSPSLDAELPLTDSERESDEEVPVINAGDQDEGQAGPNPSEPEEGQAGPNPGIQDKGQARSNPGDAAESQPQPSHVVHAGPNLEHMNLETTDASTQQKLEQMDEEFTTS
ncbi:hypothetical protein Tco_0882236, partial [Tanacetum coccineum]